MSKRTKPRRLIVGLVALMSMALVVGRVHAESAFKRDSNCAYIALLAGFSGADVGAVYAECRASYMWVG